MIFKDYSNLVSPFGSACELCRGSLQYGYVLQLKVSFKMGPFSDTRHTHPGIFILKSLPLGMSSQALEAILIKELRVLENFISNSTK